MSGYYNQSDSYEQELEDNSGGGLRKQFEAALEELKALRAEVSGSKREQTVTDLLKDKNLDPAVAAVIPKDADPKEWLEANGRLFVTSVNPADQEEVVPEIQEVPQEDPAVELEREAREQMLAAQQAGTPVVTQSDVEKVAAMSAEDILAAVKAAQAVNG